jgi:hypothetical protein
MDKKWSNISVKAKKSFSLKLVFRNDFITNPLIRLLHLELFKGILKYEINDAFSM